MPGLGLNPSAMPGAACRRLFEGKLGELGQPLPPLSGTVARPAAFPSWIVRLNPALVRCLGPDTHFGLVYQEKPSGTRCQAKEWRWCSRRSHPGCTHCSGCNGGHRAASRWMVCVCSDLRWTLQGTNLCFLLFLHVCGHRLQGMGWGRGEERFILPPKWKAMRETLSQEGLLPEVLRCQT